MFRIKKAFLAHSLNNDESIDQLLHTAQLPDLEHDQHAHVHVGNEGQQQNNLPDPNFSAFSEGHFGDLQCLQDFLFEISFAAQHSAQEIKEISIAYNNAVG